MSGRDRFLEITTGKGLEPRHRAGRILSVLLGTAIVLITVAAMVDGLRSPLGLTDAALTLLIGVLTLLVGTVSGYLARVQDAPDLDNRSPVGTILTMALGATMVIITAAVLFDVVVSDQARITANVVSLLTAVLGGGIGATASYLGLPRVAEGVPSSPIILQGDSAQDPPPEDPDPAAAPPPA